MKKPERRYHYLPAAFLLTILIVPAGLADTDDAGLSSPHTQTIESHSISQESKPEDVRQLTPGVPIERELAGGNQHSYRISLVAKQYLRVVVKQKGIDVVVLALDPGGQKLTEVDNTGGSEFVFLVAETAGEYQLKVRASDKEAKPGAYEITVAELREATDRDRVALAAEKLLEEGNQLRDQRTAESRKNAIKKYDEALPLWREADNDRGEAQTLNELGVVYSNLGDPKKAVANYLNALPLTRATGDPIIEATTLTNMGTAYWRMGESQRALEYHNQALPLARAAGDAQVEGAILGNTGAVYWAMGQPLEALKHFNQALLIARTRGDRRREAITLNNIATIDQQMGDLEKALGAHTQILQLRRAVSDRQGEATSLNNLALLHLQLGDLRKALEYYNQALEIRRSGGDRQAQATNLQGLSVVYLRLGEFEPALKHAEEALALARTVADSLLEGYVLDVLGKIHQLSGERTKALDFFEQSLAVRRKVGDRYGEAYALSNLAGTYLELANPGKALDYYGRSLELSRTIGDKLGEAATLFGLARSHSKLGDNVSALTEIEVALSIIESTRVAVPSQDFRASFLASYQDYFRFYLDLLMRMHEAQPSAGNDVRAFAASERARSRGLLELLTEAKIDVRQGVAPDLKKRETDLQNRISWVQSQLISANSRAKPDQSRIAALDADFRKMESERAQVEIEIRQRHPRYANLQYPSPLDLKAVQQTLDEKTVLLEYSLGQDSSYLFAISRNDFLTVRLPAASVITSQVNTLREAIAIKPDRMALSNYLQKGNSLYRDLVQPASRVLRGKQSLIIVPDAILHYLPFEVLLRSDRGRSTQINLAQLPYLLRDFSISYAPSATVLANLPKAEQSPRQQKSFLAYGDPLYGSRDSERSVPVRMGDRGAFGDDKPWQLQALPESRNEVERIAKLYPREQVGVFLGSQASEENLKAGAGPSGYRFVHFAVHGLLNEQRPQYSGLALTLPHDQAANARRDQMANGAMAGRTEPGSETNHVAQAEDGLLQVYEIFNLKLNADLVVLSACQSGLGQETKGEGLMGLTQAFFYAGTRSLMVSLWKVQDKSTTELMVRFYQQVNKPGLGKAEALRQAQLEMIRSAAFSHPYYWAAFVLTGQP